MLQKEKATLLMILAVASWGSSFLCWLSWTGVYFVLSARFLNTLTRLYACVLLNLQDFPTLLGKDQQRSRFHHCPAFWCEHGQSSFQRNQWTVKKVLTTREAGRLLDKNIPFVRNVTNIYCQLEKYWKYFSQLRKHQRKSSWLGLAAGNIILKIQIYKSEGAGVLVALRPIWTAALKDLNIFLFTSISVDALFSDPWTLSPSIHKSYEM